MAKLALLFLFSLPAFGQLSLSLTGPATARQGSPVNLSLSLAGSTSTQPAGIQWTLGLPAGFAITGPITPGSSITSAAKTISCTPDNLTCLAVGFNTNVISAGQIGTFQLNVPVNSPVGPASFPLSGLLAVNQAGASVALSPGALLTITILSKSDLNGDGKVDLSDVTAMINQSLGGGAGCTSDQNGDGKCDLLDVYLVVRAGLGL